MNAHYRTLAEYIIREITLQQNHSRTFMQKVREFLHRIDDYSYFLDSAVC